MGPPSRSGDGRWLVGSRSSTVGRSRCSPRLRAAPASSRSRDDSVGTFEAVRGWFACGQPTRARRRDSPGLCTLGGRLVRFGPRRRGTSADSTEKGDDVRRRGPAPSPPPPRTPPRAAPASAASSALPARPTPAARAERAAPPLPAPDCAPISLRGPSIARREASACRGRERRKVSSNTSSAQEPPGRERRKSRTRLDMSPGTPASRSDIS